MSSGRTRIRKEILDALKTIRRELAAVRHISEKRLPTRDLLEKYYLERRRVLRRSKKYEQLQCRMLLHRMILTVDMSPRSAFPWKALGKIPGAQIGRHRRLWKQIYRKATPITGIPEWRTFSIASEPTNGWAPGFQITLVPSEDGVEWGALYSVLKRLPNFNIVTLEIAWDFPMDSRVDTALVNREGLFGKSRPQYIEQNPLYRTWGSRKGTKFVRSYVRYQTWVHRVELEVHARLLRKYGINHPFDFPRLVDLLVKKHISFGRIDHKKLVEWLQRNGMGEREVNNVLRQVKEKEHDLWDALRFLRHRVGLTNVQRLLTRGPIDRIVRKAAREWGSNWEREIEKEGEKFE